MANPQQIHKASAGQYFLQLGYNGQGFYGVVPQAAGPSVWDAVLARMRGAAPAAEPYAISWAARTDRGVHAHCNWLTYRLFDGGPGPGRERVIAALHAAADDGLIHVRAQVLPMRAMARSMAQAKHYRYRVSRPQAVDVSAWRRLGAAAAALSGSLDVRRLAHSRTVRDLADTCRDEVQVTVSAAGAFEPPGATFDIDVRAQGFVRHQVRHMVQAMLAALDGQARLDDVRFLASGAPGPLPQHLGGAAPADGLCLMHITPQPQWRFAVTAPKNSSDVGL